MHRSVTALLVLFVVSAEASLEPIPLIEPDQLAETLKKELPSFHGGATACSNRTLIEALKCKIITAGSYRLATCEASGINHLGYLDVVDVDEAAPIVEALAKAGLHFSQTLELRNLSCETFITGTNQCTGASPTQCFVDEKFLN